MISFVDNWLRPLQLTAAQVEVELDLPDGQYVLTVADSETAATRWEILAAMVESGQATLLRESAQEWGAGSVIYCSVNSAILAQIFLAQEALDGRVASLENLGLQQVYAAPTGSDVALDTAMPYWTTAPGAGLVTFSAPADLPGSKRLENTVEATLSAGGRVRIAGNGRDIIEALVHRTLTYRPLSGLATPISNSQPRPLPVSDSLSPCGLESTPAGLSASNWR
ncbi:hypothetical protein UMZ34_23990 [Halopseudomonas pachastrellae]|nr:hypothetical protein UMZ34_23990 [Halopseudomonas pachastrellae]